MSELHSSSTNHSSVHSDSLHHESWLETWWPTLVIAFGLIFVASLVFFKPVD